MKMASKKLQTSEEKSGASVAVGIDTIVGSANLPPGTSVPRTAINEFSGNQVDEDESDEGEDAEEEDDRNEGGVNSSTKLEFLDNALAVNKSRCRPKIQGVPFIMDRNKNFKYYEPKMVSIGPICRKIEGRPHMDVTEEMKVKLAALFIKNHRLDGNNLFSKIKRKIKKLRKCYDQKAIEHIKNDDDLAKIFLVDGCAILHFIHSAMKKDGIQEIMERENIKVDWLTFMHHDMFLMENQLPFRVLDLIMGCLVDTDEGDMRRSIENYVFETIKAPGEKQKKQQHHYRQNVRPIHLLDLLRSILLQSVEKDRNSRGTHQHLSKIVIQFIGEPLEKLQNLVERLGKRLEILSCPETESLQYFRTVKELKAAGIRLRPSNSGYLTDISFNLGTLRLPAITVDDSTASKFLNLISYEMCPDFVNDLGISSYVVFLDSLIDGAEDVKELRDRKILKNLLGSDEEVAELFNEITTNLVANPEIYKGVKEDIQKRYDNKWLTWIAQFINLHFQSPWSVLAFFGAIIAIASTVVSAVYSILSYYK